MLELVRSDHCKTRARLAAVLEICQAAQPYLYCLLGLCGILASKVSKKTVVTDGDQSVLDLIQENVTLNQLPSKKILHCIMCIVYYYFNVYLDPPDVLALEWGTDASQLVQRYGKFDFITGSDIM